MSDEFPPAKRMLALGAVAHDLHGRVDRLDERLRDTSEDSYATRNELRDEIAQFKQFIHRVEGATSGIVNLTKQIADYGYDAEAAACDFMCGLEYVSDFERAKMVYESSIWKLTPLIENLERAGIRVETGVIAIDPPDHDENIQTQTFVTDLSPGHLEYAGSPRNERVYDGMPHCSRFEIMEVREGFRVDNVDFVRDPDSTRWYETSRDVRTLQGSKQDAIEWMQAYERAEFGPMPMDRQWEIELRAIDLEAHDSYRVAPSWPSRAVEIEQSQEWMRQHFPELSQEYAALFDHEKQSHDDDRVQLAAEFRQAITVAQLERAMLQEGSCDWCGTGLSTIDDHEKVDGQQMCHPCHDEYFPESEKGAASTAQPLKPRGFIGKDILATTESERSDHGENTQMDNELLRAGYDAQQLRIEQLEAWIEQAITRPSMSRELRLQGLELIEARSPDIRLAVERICPQRSQGLGQSLELER